MHEICLTRLAITGPVDLQTPKVVLLEILDAQMIFYSATDDFANVNSINQLLNKINTSQVRKVSPPYDHRQLSYIARFVNSACTWQKGILEDAFEYLETFFKSRNLREPHNLLNFRFGPQTPEYPKSLNACVLYGMSRAFKLPTDFTTTIDEMAYKLSVLGKLITDQSIKHSIKQTIYNLLLTDEFDESELVSVLASSSKGKRKLHELGNTIYGEGLQLSIQIQPQPAYIKPKYEYNLVELNYDTLEEVYTRLPLGLTTNDRRVPTTQLEAIAMAAKYFYYDISDTSNPLAEYHALTQVPHFPYDRHFSKLIYEAYHNPEIFDNPRLDQNFNPYFRLGMYTNETLRNLCKREGIPEARWREDNPYTLLQSAHVMSTFSHGIHFGIGNSQNSYMTPLTDLDSNEVVCYGVRTRIKDRAKGLCNDESSLTFYTYEELAGSFRTHRKFLDPLTTTNSVFPSTAIEKLSYLAGLPRRSLETEDMYRKRVVLKETIDRVNICSSINVETIKEFVRRYDISMENQQQYIRLLLMDILHIAMYMRSWNGPPDHYPLRSEDTRVMEQDKGEVDVRVGAAIRIYTIHCTENPALGDMISGLPLMTKDDAHNIKVCTQEAEGLTIKGRLDIVTAENRNANVNSCIRITSNRLAASAYYYMQIINMDTPFDITMLAYIQ